MAQTKLNNPKCYLIILRQANTNKELCHTFTLNNVDELTVGYDKREDKKECEHDVELRKLILKEDIGVSRNQVMITRDGDFFKIRKHERAAAVTTVKLRRLGKDGLLKDNELPIRLHDKDEITFASYTIVYCDQEDTYNRILQSGHLKSETNISSVTNTRSYPQDVKPNQVGSELSCAFFLEDNLLCCGDTQLELTPKQYALLSILFDKKGKLCKYEELLSKLYPEAYNSDITSKNNYAMDSLRKLVSKLRFDLEDKFDEKGKNLISTMRGHGLKLHL